MVQLSMIALSCPNIHLNPYKVYINHSHMMVMGLTVMLICHNFEDITFFFIKISSLGVDIL